MKEYEQKKDYEISFMVMKKGDESAVEDVLVQHGADITTRGVVVETRLAYPIKKNKIGFFGFFHFKAMPDMAEKLAAALKLSPDVLRSLLITPPVVKTESRRLLRRETRDGSREGGETRQVSSEPRPARQAPRGVLTNKDLEDKLEEILK